MIGSDLHIAGVVIYFVSSLCIPFLFIFLCRKFKFFDFLGVTICCFLAGMLVGNTYPQTWIQKQAVGEINNIIVPIGLILMLLGTHLRKWIRVSGKVLLGYFLSLIGVVGISILLFFIFSKGRELPFVAGMLTGTYVGGTPNMAAIKIAFNINDILYNQIFLCDLVASSVYLLFIMVFAQKLLGLILRKYKTFESDRLDEDPSFKDDASLTKPIWLVIFGLLISMLVFAVPILIWLLLAGSLKNMSMVFVILSITLLAVSLSFIPAVRNNNWNFKTGDYLFSIFFTFLGTLTYFKDLVGINPQYVLFTFIVLFGSVFIHVLLCKLFKIDRDTMIITSAAGIMSPPFIPAIANAIKNKDLIAPGIAVGIIGLALGNVLGIFVIKFLLGFN